MFYGHLIHSVMHDLNGDSMKMHVAHACSLYLYRIYHYCVTIFELYTVSFEAISTPNPNLTQIYVIIVQLNLDGAKGI